MTITSGSGAPAPRTIDEVMEAMYASISGPAGAPRDWGLNASLFLPNAAIAVVRRHANGTHEVEHLTTEGYRRSREPFLLSHGFFERETGRQVARHGPFAHVVSDYESRWREDEPPFETGTNLLQLVETPDGWRIVAVSWVAGVAATRIPPLALVR